MSFAPGWGKSEHQKEYERMMMESFIKSLLVISRKKKIEKLLDVDKYSR